MRALPGGMHAPVFRFAPSPNGRLHMGHALSALTGDEMARRMGGRFLVRIEDIDTARAREEFVAGIFEDLAWLGLHWEQPVLRQSEHFADYKAAADRLDAMGLLYPCFATRAEIEAASRLGGAGVDPEGAPLYPGLHRGLNAAEIAERKRRGERYCLRLDMHKAVAMATEMLRGRPLTFTEIDGIGGTVTVEARPQRWGDVVLIRKDTPASYHLAVVVDDARQGVTHVTRGRDLYAATDVHRLLQVLLELPEPLYHHHRLIADPMGRKLAKSARDRSLKSLREDEVDPEFIRRELGFSAT